MNRSNVYSVTVGTALSISGQWLKTAIEQTIQKINDSAPGTPAHREQVVYLPVDAKDDTYIGKIGMCLEGENEIFLVTIGNDSVIDGSMVYDQKEIKVEYYVLGPVVSEVFFMGEEWRFTRSRMKRFANLLRNELHLC